MVYQWCQIIQDLRFSQQCSYRFKSSGMWSSVTWQIVPIIFKAKHSTCPVLQHHIPGNWNIWFPNKVPYLYISKVLQNLANMTSLMLLFFKNITSQLLRAHLLIYHKTVQHIILSLIHKMWGHNWHVKSYSNCSPTTRIHRLVCKLIGTWVFVFCGFIQNIEKWVFTGDHAGFGMWSSADKVHFSWFGPPTV